MIWFLVSFFLVGIVSLPGDVVLQPTTTEPRARVAAVVQDLGRTIRLERAFDSMDRLRTEGSAELEAFAIRFGDTLARTGSSLSDLESLRDELDQALRTAWDQQLAARAALRAEVSADEWRAIFPAPK